MMTRSVIGISVAFAALTGVSGPAHSQPIRVSMDTSIGHYEIGLDDSAVAVREGAGFYDISFLYQTERMLFPPPDGETIATESFAVLFSITKPIANKGHIYVVETDIVDLLQESTLFLSGFDRGFPHAAYFAAVDFNVLSLSTSPVPLPSTLALTGSALIGLGAIGYGCDRRRRPAHL